GCRASGGGGAGGAAHPGAPPARAPRPLPRPAGGVPLTGTNPLAIAVPSSDGAPVVADVSMGAVTHGDVLAGRARAEDLVPFGGPQAHKAFALAVGLQLLVDALNPEGGFGAVLLVARPESDPVPASRAPAHRSPPTGRPPRPPLTNRDMSPGQTNAREGVTRCPQGVQFAHFAPGRDRAVPDPSCGQTTYGPEATARGSRARFVWRRSPSPSPRSWETSGRGARAPGGAAARRGRGPRGRPCPRGWRG